MVGHDAEGVNREGIRERVGAEVIEEPFCPDWVEKDFVSVFAAESDEKPCGANVTIEW